MVMPYQFNNGDVEAVTFCPMLSLEENELKFDLKK